MNTQEWLAKLVSFDTTSRNSNLNLIHSIEEWLSQHKITSFKTFDSTENKANLFATIPTTSGDIQHGIVLSGHTDVVPVDDQDWTTDPFKALQKDDRIYGRGTADMKGFLAVILALVPMFKQSKLPYPIHLAFSYDEEIGCLGAPHLIANLKQQGIKPLACIVGEPTEMQAIIAHKGIQIFKCQLQGKATHSSQTPKGCNAIDYAADLVSWIRKYANDLKKTGPFDHNFDVPFTTITTNIIKGGTATNIIPSYCEFFFEFRNLPHVNPNDIIKPIEEYVQNILLPNMQKEYHDAKSQSKKPLQYRHLPPLQTSIPLKYYIVLLTSHAKKSLMLPRLDYLNKPAYQLLFVAQEAYNKRTERTNISHSHNSRHVKTF